MRTGTAISLLACLAGLAACAQRTPACLLPSQAAMLQIDMFFGRDIAGRAPVSDAEWESFTRHVMTPRFPDGFTIMDAHGQWLNPATHHIGSEASKMVRIDVVPGADIALRVRAVADAYKAAFHQEAVGVVTSVVCAAF